MLSISRTRMCTQLGPSRDIALYSDRSLPYTGSPLTLLLYTHEISKSPFCHFLQLCQTTSKSQSTTQPPIWLEITKSVLDDYPMWATWELIIYPSYLLVCHVD